MCDVGYLSANFSLLGPLCSRVTPDVRDRQTSDRCVSVWRLSVAYIGRNSRTERSKKTKIGREVAHAMLLSDVCQTKASLNTCTYYGWGITSCAACSGAATLCSHSWPWPWPDMLTLACWLFKTSATTFDLLILKVVSWTTSVPILVSIGLGQMYATDVRQTSDVRRVSSLNTPVWRAGA